MDQADSHTVRAAVLAAINDIPDPCSVAAHSAAGLVDMGLVVDLLMTDTTPGQFSVEVAMRATSPGCVFFGVFDAEILNRVAAVPGVASVNVTWSMEPLWEPSMMSEELQARRSKFLGSLRAYASSQRASRDEVPREAGAHAGAWRPSRLTNI